MSRSHDLGWIRVELGKDRSLFSKNYVVSSLEESNKILGVVMEYLRATLGPSLEGMFTMDGGLLGVSVFSAELEPAFRDGVDRLVAKFAQDALEAASFEEQAHKWINDSRWRQIILQGTHDAVDEWRVVNLDDHEVAGRLFLSSDLNESLRMAGIVVAAAIKNDFDHSVLISVDPNKILVVLNMFGEGKLPPNYPDMTEVVEQVLV